LAVTHCRKRAHEWSSATHDHVLRVPTSYEVGMCVFNLKWYDFNIVHRFEYTIMLLIPTAI
jgi:hypothetical protein